jgi:hypothetical protein
MINSLSGKSLLKLSLNIISPKTVKTINEYSPNISFLHIKLASPIYMDSVIPLVRNLSLLKVLHIQMESYEVDGSQLIEILGDHLMSVEYLYMNVLTGLSSFQHFINNCKVDLKKWIIPFTYNEPQRKDYLTCVDDYQKVHNSLEVLGMEENEDEFDWNNEELEIVGSLKRQRVDIVPSKQISKLFY